MAAIKICECGGAHWADAQRCPDCGKQQRGSDLLAKIAEPGDDYRRGYEAGIDAAAKEADAIAGRH